MKRSLNSLSCDEIVQIGEAFVYQVRLGSKIIQFPWNTVTITFAKDTADD